MQDVRWKQRFANFRKALAQLTEFVNKGELNKFELQGLIKCFEYTFELGWKTLKDYAEEEGYDVQSPRTAIQTAYQAGCIADGHAWIEMLEKRNLMAHTYNEAYAQEAEQLIRIKYYALLLELERKLGEKL